MAQMVVPRVINRPHPIGELDQHLTRRATDPRVVWIPLAEQLVDQVIVRERQQAFSRSSFRGPFCHRLIPIVSH
jgi:hypothetical protein